jgi:hypothetical protein
LRKLGLEKEKKVGLLKGPYDGRSGDRTEGDLRKEGNLRRYDGGSQEGAEGSAEIWLRKTSELIPNCSIL